MARDNYGGEGGVWSWVMGFAQVEVDVETGQVDLTEYTGVTDCGTVLHPRSLGAQIHGARYRASDRRAARSGSLTRSGASP